MSDADVRKRERELILNPTDFVAKTKYKRSKQLHGLELFRCLIYLEYHSSEQILLASVVGDYRVLLEIIKYLEINLQSVEPPWWFSNYIEDSKKLNSLLAGSQQFAPYLSSRIRYKIKIVNSDNSLLSKEELKDLQGTLDKESC